LSEVFPRFKVTLQYENELLASDAPFAVLLLVICYANTLLSLTFSNSCV